MRPGTYRQQTPGDARAVLTGTWRLAAWAAFAAIVASPSAAHAQVITREEALALAYPGATFAAERVFLTQDQQRAATALAGGAVDSALVGRYIVRKDGVVVGRAYLDTHVVRTKKESLLVSLTADGRVKRIDVTAFLEPPEYQAPPAWVGQYEGRALTPDLEIQRAIRPLAGATLTARTTNDAVRRVLAIDQVLGATPERNRP
jgi:electron transport complex protein RnfG